MTHEYMVKMILELTACLFCVGIFSESAIAANVKVCSDNPNGYCIDLAVYYCNLGHKIGHSGCGFKEKCCFPYAEKKAKFEHGVDQCGVPSVNPKSRIIGGKDAKIEQYPWMASLQTMNQPTCGASIISEHWMLTAAHCVTETHGFTEDLSFVVGSTRTKLRWGSYNQRYAVSKKNIYIHSKYTRGHPHNGYDIALVKLTRPIPLGTVDQRRICLPDKGETFEDRVCAVTGWGYTKEPEGIPTSAGGSPTLRQANLPVMNQSVCEFYLGKMEPGTLCAGYRSGGEDACSGDSGGPLVCLDLGGVWKQTGIVSVGTGCGREGGMGVYTDVAAFREWIDHVMEKY